MEILRLMLPFRSPVCAVTAKGVETLPCSGRAAYHLELCVRAVLKALELAGKPPRFPLFEATDGQKSLFGRVESALGGALGFRLRFAWRLHRELLEADGEKVYPLALLAAINEALDEGRPRDPKTLLSLARRLARKLEGEKRAEGLLRSVERKLVLARAAEL